MVKSDGTILSRFGKWKFSPFDIINGLIMLGVVFLMLYPLYYMAIISISAGGPVSRGEVSFYPVQLSFKAYEVIFSSAPIVQAYQNTLLYTSLGVAINLIMTGLCAYPLSRNHFYGKHIFAMLIVFTMFFDGGMIPRYLVVDSLGLLNSVWAIVLPPAINVFYMVMMRTFFQAIPEALIESAHIDGANDLKVFWKVVIPLSAPLIATMVLFYAVGHWNSFFSALIYLNESSKFPIQLILRNIVIQGDTSAQSTEMSGVVGTMVVDQNIKYAVVMIAILPILVLYPFLQKYFVKGSMVGSLKG
ncbi:carbohydrate ABC transporter permease [Paenibacillus ginsengarvi]|uniref:Carbohydrate ABC transporter permease n=1 Tax=Paenibacillus ginsengarvi TaxID=400777 RepID=A0A3B0CMU7_9BACL|nr:carbohydrate ABC transporter permease [Paenibacillus ginsengarvi]RKN85834.1 carbohydrate ABC transporter permease [Paenibacillus ginsengarvi]